MITQKDLIGGIADFPIEVVEKMLDRQYEQFKRRRVESFQESVTSGFTWIDTIEGQTFWRKVICDKDFNLFFSKYPKRRNTIISINKSTKVKLNFNL